MVSGFRASAQYTRHVVGNSKRVKLLGDFHIPDHNGGRQKNHCYSD